MMIDEAKTLVRPAIPAGSRRALPSEPPPAETNRVDWLFRDALRRRQVHPLMEPLRRYRGQGAA